jgi:hypothetical protein
MDKHLKYMKVMTLINILATMVQFRLKWCCDVDDSQKSSCVLNVFFYIRDLYGPVLF